MSETIKVVIGGDLFPRPINYQLFRDGQVETLFGKEILSVFNRADYSVCNLEGCFTDDDAKPKLKYGPNIRAPKECIKSIVELGVDCVSLANNHATDYGKKGLLDTQNVLRESGVEFFGAGENLPSVTTHFLTEIKGKRFCFYGVAETLEDAPTQKLPGVNLYDEYRVCRELETLKEKCDYLIVLYHGGMERIHYNTESIRTRFHRMADSGADIIIAQHTHAVGLEEYYNGAYLLYGQGNFCFHFSKKNNEWTETALLLEVDFSDEKTEVHKHLVRRKGPVVIYDEKQDLTDFYERSEKHSAGYKFEDEFIQFADEQLIRFLPFFRGKNIFDRVYRKLFSKEKYIKYLRSRYTERQILTILVALQSEEFREMFSQGMMNMLAAIQNSENKDEK